MTGHEGEYLFLNVKEGNDRLIALHDCLYSDLLSPFLLAEHTFVPHLTVGRLPNESAWRSAVSEVCKLSINEQFLVTSVSIYVVESDGRRWVESSVMLGTRDYEK
jgi:2'-5' RNA ligase